jgi:TRAP-type mannitol/chloroaromatic compound transport system permease large subunit
LGFDAVWFGTIALINLEMGLITPPFGLSLFVMKGVAPPDTTMGDIFRAALPFVFLQFIALGLIMAFPSIALWLPRLMQ